MGEDNGKINDRWRVLSGTVPPRPAELPASGGCAAPAAGRAEALAAAEARRLRGCDRWVALGIVVMVAAGAMSAWLPEVVPPAASCAAGEQGAPAPTALAVTRQNRGNHAGDRGAGGRRVLYGAARISDPSGTCRSIFTMSGRCWHRGVHDRRCG